jgi:hypothetical protein
LGVRLGAYTNSKIISYINALSLNIRSG